jgi:fructokinase
MTQQEHIVVFGEVLFDCFEDGSRVLGGAPFNVAWNLRALGAHPLLISRIGNDDMGKHILDEMNNWGMSTDGIQIDEEHPTGSVSIHIQDNEPHFDILDDVAYDYIDEQCLPYLALTGIIYHGSLALRHDTPKIALGNLLTQMDAKVFVDVNLRPPWWDKALIKTICHAASWLKLNEHELAMLTEGDNKQQQIIQLFSSANNIKELILTEGEEGAMAITPEGELHQVKPQMSQNFVDAVGAGDAFSSVILLGKHLSWPTELTMSRAQEFASAVVGLRGATTTDRSFYQAFLQRWDQ